MQVVFSPSRYCQSINHSAQIDLENVRSHRAPCIIHCYHPEHPFCGVLLSDTRKDGNGRSSCNFYCRGSRSGSFFPETYWERRGSKKSPYLDREDLASHIHFLQVLHPNVICGCCTNITHKFYRESSILLRNCGICMVGVDIHTKKLTYPEYYKGVCLPTRSLFSSHIRFVAGTRTCLLFLHVKNVARLNITFTLNKTPILLFGERIEGVRPQNGVLSGNTMGPRISARFSEPHRSSTSVRANGKAVPINHVLGGQEMKNYEVSTNQGPD